MRRISVPLLLATLVTAPASAQRLPATVVPDHYDLTFKVDLPNERFIGLETIQVRVDRPTSRVVLNALDLRFDDVTIDAAATSQQAAVSIDQHDETATLTLAQPLLPGTA